MNIVFADNNSKILYDKAKREGRESFSFGFIGHDTTLNGYYKPGHPCILVQSEGDGLDGTLYYRVRVCTSYNRCTPSNCNIK